MRDFEGAQREVADRARIGARKEQPRVGDGGRELFGDKRAAEGSLRGDANGSEGLLEEEVELGAGKIAEREVVPVGIDPETRRGWEAMMPLRWPYRVTR